jgi:hypothetical protein
MMVRATKVPPTGIPPKMNDKQREVTPIQRISAKEMERLE